MQIMRIATRAILWSVSIQREKRVEGQQALDRWARQYIGRMVSSSSFVSLASYLCRAQTIGSKAAACMRTSLSTARR